MPRPMTLITLKTCLTTLLTMLAVAPNAADAGQYRFAEMIPSVERLRCSAEQFERLACRRRISPHDRHRITQLAKNVCRLGEGVATSNALGRIKADLHNVQLAMRLVAKRVRVSCVLNEDPLLMQTWERVRCDFALVEEAWDLRCARGHQTPPPLPQDVRYQRQADPYLWHRGGRNPYERHGADRPRHQPEPHPHYPPARGYPRPSDFGQRNSTAIWLDALMAVLSR